MKDFLPDFSSYKLANVDEWLAILTNSNQNNLLLIQLFVLYINIQHVNKNAKNINRKFKGQT